MAGKRDHNTCIPEFFKNIPTKRLPDLARQQPIIGDPPAYLNTKVANWTDVVVVDNKCYDKDDVQALILERDTARREAEKAKAMLDTFRTSLEIGIEHQLTCAQLKTAIQRAGAKADPT